MPKLYLASPNHPGEEYPNGGDEQYWINKIADRTESLLDERDIKVVRSKPGMGEDSKLKAAHREHCSLYLALGSHSAPSEAAGQMKGIDACYFEQDADSRRIAELFASRLRAIYPEPELVGTHPTAERRELQRAEAPAVCVNLAYHDNPQDEAWLVNSVDEIAVALSQAAADAMEVESELA